MRIPAIVSLLAITLLCGCFDANRIIHISASPKYKTDGAATYLVFPYGKEQIEVFWSYRDQAMFPIVLEQSKTYHFTIKREKHRASVGDFSYFIDDLLKIELGKNVIYDCTICEVHKVLMKQQTVPISYGLILRDPSVPYPDQSISDLRFPHYRASVLGGCLRSDSSPKTKVLMVCSECEAAHAEWVKEQITSHTTITKSSQEHANGLK